MKNLIKNMKLSLLVISTLTMASTAIAQEMPSRGPIPFGIFDANKDGSITESEFYDARAIRMKQKADQGRPMKNAANAPDFSVYDTNNDGKLNKLELLEGQNKQMQKNRQNRGQRNNR
ncbi:EF-hand domain-containing protein [Sulfurimonas sp.]|nr:EF-hand domain-containing protein [Sulfurimonas sp.]